MPFISRVSTGYQGYAKQGKLVVIQISQVGIASTNLYDNIGGLAAYMNGFLSEYRNPSFYNYTLDEVS